MNEKELEDLRETFIQFIQAVKVIKEVFNNVQKFIDNLQRRCDQMELDNRLRKTWYIPENTMKKHQVIDRKPLFTRIRNNI